MNRIFICLNTLEENKIDHIVISSANLSVPREVLDLSVLSI